MEEQKQPNKINLLNQEDIKEDIQKDFLETPKKSGLPKWITILGAIIVVCTIGYFVYSHYFGTGVCFNQCGDGKCQEVVCQAIGCPCAETIESCPEDCKINCVGEEENYMPGENKTCCSGLEEIPLTRGDGKICTIPAGYICTAFCGNSSFI